LHTLLQHYPLSYSNRIPCLIQIEELTVSIILFSGFCFFPLSRGHDRMSIAVVFSEGEIAPQGAISCAVGAILWFTRFGERFRFPGGDFCRLKHTQMLNLFQKNQYLLLWNQSLWCTCDSMVRNKAYKTHIGLVTHQSNYCIIHCTKYPRSL